LFQHIKASSLNDELDNWLRRNIPAADIDEFEGVIDEVMTYAAYGHHEHAEEILKEHIELNPDSENKLQQTLEKIRARKS